MVRDRFCCDRCGATYNYNAKRIIGDRAIQRYAGVGILSTTNMLIRFDLCDDCMDALTDWLENIEEEGVDNND